MVAGGWRMTNGRGGMADDRLWRTEDGWPDVLASDIRHLTSGMGEVLDLEILRLLHGTVLRIYEVTRSFPDEERFGLTAQLRRSAASVPTNIIEGNHRFYKNEYLRLLYVARGSLAETEYHLLLAKDLGYMDEIAFKELKQECETAGRMLNGLINSLKRKPSASAQDPPDFASNIKHLTSDI